MKWNLKVTKVQLIFFEDGESFKEVSRMWVSSNQVIQGSTPKPKALNGFSS